MATPSLADAVLADFRPDHLRRLDDEFRLQTTAESTKGTHDMLRIALPKLLQNAEQAGAVNSQAQAKLVGCFQSVEASLDRGFGALSDAMAADRQEQQRMRASLEDGMANLSDQMARQSDEMRAIAKLLASPYDAKAKELRNEGIRWFESATQTIGRDRTENFKDSLRLLQLTVENPIGRQDYVAWFYLGWLRWKFTNEPLEAEEAFYTAKRLSAPKADAWHVKALRHLAYLQYQNGKVAEALESISDALKHTQDGRTCFDAARYFAAAKQVEKALGFLDISLRLDPTSCVDALTEPELIPHAAALAAIDARLTLEVQRNCEGRLGQIDRLGEIGKRVTAKTGRSCFDADLLKQFSDTQSLVRDMSDSQYLAALNVEHLISKLHVSFAHQIAEGLEVHLDSLNEVYYKASSAHYEASRRASDEESQFLKRAGKRHEWDLNILQKAILASKLKPLNDRKNVLEAELNRRKEIVTAFETFANTIEQELATIENVPVQLPRLSVATP